MLLRRGVKVSAGQMVGYVIVDARRRIVTPAELVDEATGYDVKKYKELLWAAVRGMLKPFEQKLTVYKTGNFQHKIGLG